MASVNATTPSATPTSGGSYARSLWQRKDFISYLAWSNIKSRDASTTAGLFWWIINPLTMAGIYYFLLGIVFDAGEGNPRYFPFLLSGLFAFFYTRQAIVGSTAAMLRNARLMVNVPFPRLTLVIAANLEAAFGFVCALIVFFVITIPMGEALRPQLAALPVILLIHTVLNVGFGAVAARLTIPFRDLRNALPHILRIWLYLSPALYSIERLPARFQEVMLLNPMTSLLELYRWALMGEALSASSWAIASGWALLVGVVGAFAFVRSERHFVRFL